MKYIKSRKRIIKENSLSKTLITKQIIEENLPFLYIPFDYFIEHKLYVEISEAYVTFKTHRKKHIIPINGLKDRNIDFTEFLEIEIHIGLIFDKMTDNNYTFIEDEIYKKNIDINVWVNRPTEDIFSSSEMIITAKLINANTNADIMISLNEKEKHNSITNVTKKILKKSLPFLDIPFDYIIDNNIHIEINTLFPQIICTSNDDIKKRIFIDEEDFSKIDYSKYSNVGLSIQLIIKNFTQTHINYIIKYIKENNTGFIVEFDDSGTVPMIYVVGNLMNNPQLNSDIMISMNEHINTSDDSTDIKDINKIKTIIDNNLPFIDIPYDYIIKNNVTFILAVNHSAINLIYKDSDIKSDTIYIDNISEFKFDFSKYKAITLDIKFIVSRKHFEYLQEYIKSNNSGVVCTWKGLNSTHDIILVIKGDIMKNDFETNANILFNINEHFIRFTKNDIVKRNNLLYSKIKEKIPFISLPMNIINENYYT